MTDRALKIIEKETGGISYKSHKFCYEEYTSPDHSYEDNQEFLPKQYGETERRKTHKGLKAFADSLCGRSPLFRYFLDGSRRTYKVDDIAYGERIYPIVAGQVAVACCERKNPDKFAVHKFENQLVLCVTEVADKDGLGKKFFNEITGKINSSSNFKTLDLELAKILTYPDKNDANYENLAIAKIHDEMINFEKKIVVQMTKENLLNEDSYLIKDGSIEYQRMRTGSHRDLSVIKSSYRRVVGVSKRFNPEMCVDSKGKSNAAKIAALPLYHRTPAFMFESKRSYGEEGPVYLSAWYIRIRETKHTISPFDGVIKVEKIIVTDDELRNGLDTEEIDLISANLINERNPVAYGKDNRWANHLYPVYLTESFIKSRFLSDNFFLNAL
jgi:hypothetical protein